MDQKSGELVMSLRSGPGSVRQDAKPAMTEAAVCDSTSSEKEDKACSTTGGRMKS